MEELPVETDRNGLQRLSYLPDGWKFWDWRGHKIHYIDAGEASKPAVLLVHGFGASSQHWRYVIPELAKDYRVYAIDLLGFGWSSKPSVEYNGYRIWSDQISDFVDQIIGSPAILVGNSLGAYASLLTTAYHPEVSRGLVLVNGAGRFEEVQATLEAETGINPESVAEDSQKASNGQAAQPASLLKSVLEPLQTIAKRVAVYFAFLAAKQPSRIRQVLRQVYVSEDNIDDDLVDSIVRPAQDSNAADVFYRVISSRGESINALLNKVQAPVFLLWGEKDPWITPASADKIQRIFPAAERADILGGHCPHDDVPSLFLPPLKQWLQAKT